MREHAGRHYAIQLHYALPDDAWCVELSEAIPSPAAWDNIPDAVTHLPGEAVLVAVIPDEDPALEPTIRIPGRNERVIPYEIMRWFMDTVAEEIADCRTALAREKPEVDT